jgi:hypothetical protein
MQKFLQAMLVAALIAGSAWAVEVAGVKVPDSVTVAGKELKLNGAGVRSRLFVKIYVGALYLAQKESNAANAIGDAAAKRVALHLLRDLKAEQMSGALNEGIAANNSAAELAQLDGKIKEFTGILNGVGNAPKGARIDIDLIPGKGTQVSVNGEVKGSVAGDEFGRALLKVWLGDKPVEDSLKKAMLGG